MNLDNTLLAKALIGDRMRDTHRRRLLGIAAELTPGGRRSLRQYAIMRHKTSADSRAPNPKHLSARL